MLMTVMSEKQYKEWFCSHLCDGPDFPILSCPSHWGLHGQDLGLPTSQPQNSVWYTVGAQCVLVLVECTCYA